MVITRQIVAFGGGGFSTEPDNPLLDRYLLSLVSKERPRVCFVPTATGDAQGYVDRFRVAYATLPCETSLLSVFRAPKNLREFVMEQDIFFVGGGNTRNLLALWREWGIDVALREAYQAGKIMAGVSAGGICWFEDGLSDSVVTAELHPLRAMGWLEGSFCPHWDGESARQDINRHAIQNRLLKPGWAADDGVAIHFVDEQVHRVVSSRPEAMARRMQVVQDQWHEEVVEPGYLGGTTTFIRRAAPRDVPEMHASHMRSIREVCSSDHTPEEIAGWGNRPLTEDLVRRRVQMIREGSVWVVESYGKILGSAVANLAKPDTGYLYGLYLCPEILGQGRGRRMMELVEQDLRERGAKRIELEATLTAKAFYLKVGYVENGPMMTAPIGGSSVRCWPMIKNF